MKAALKFRCARCYELHDEEWEAETCCPNEVDEVWVCGECGDDHGTEHSAIDCCGGDPIDTREGWQRHIAELEQAGQQRLLD